MLVSSLMFHPATTHTHTHHAHYAHTFYSFPVDLLALPLPLPPRRLVHRLFSFAGVQPPSLPKGVRVRAPKRLDGTSTTSDASTASAVRAAQGAVPSLSALPSAAIAAEQPAALARHNRAGQQQDRVQATPTTTTATSTTGAATAAGSAVAREFSKRVVPPEELRLLLNAPTPDIVSLLSDTSASYQGMSRDCAKERGGGFDWSNVSVARGRPGGLSATLFITQ